MAELSTFSPIDQLTNWSRCKYFDDDMLHSLESINIKGIANKRLIVLDCVDEMIICIFVC